MNNKSYCYFVIYFFHKRNANVSYNKKVLIKVECQVLTWKFDSTRKDTFPHISDTRLRNVRRGTHWSTWHVWFLLVASPCLGVRWKGPRQMRLRARRTARERYRAAKNGARSIARRAGAAFGRSSVIDYPEHKGLGVRGAAFHGRVNAGVSSPIQNNPPWQMSRQDSLGGGPGSTLV